MTFCNPIGYLPALLNRRNVVRVTRQGTIRAGSAGDRVVLHFERA
jgi:hypothetical protein